MHLGGMQKGGRASIDEQVLFILSLNELRISNSVASRLIK